MEQIVEYQLVQKNRAGLVIDVIYTSPALEEVERELKFYRRVYGGYRYEIVRIEGKTLMHRR